MYAQTIEAFEETLQKSYAWVDEVADNLGTPDRQKGYQALRAVLHALRDRMMLEEATHLGAQLPVLVRGLYYEDWRPAAQPETYDDKGTFLERIATELPDESLPTEAAATAVFECLARHVTSGEISDVRGQLPAEIQAMWR